MLASSFPTDGTASLQTELLSSSTLDSAFSTEGSADTIRSLSFGQAAAVQYSSLSMMLAVRLDPLDGAALDDVRAQVLADMKSDELQDALAAYGASMQHSLDSSAMGKLPARKIAAASSN